MCIDDAMAGSADDLVVDAAGLPVLDGAGVPMRRARLHFDIARGVLEEFGWSSALSKEQPPSLAVEALGVLVSLEGDDGMVRLSDAKRVRYGDLVAAARSATVLSPAAVLRLVGRLQFAAQVYPVGAARHACTAGSACPPSLAHACALA
jgi:hypothetical protein